ncbi:TIGR03936 family radical SAM-associated protein [Butyrivibrio sp. MC2013]|uniref:TIGR03936 family radical SAM-associated protein n=1 Tax=Butyrivibrio sp. MC2013 TaxID=1280686 RepID=UPI00040DD529|nr:TIGR03936 family radical SAM-associated protein [Butyrivibrio sp. MC2013]
MIKIRLKFDKKGPIRFIGHLDLMRYFQKVNRRASIPVAYSEGYSPHQILSFAEPLSVGATSDGEYLDMQLSEDMDTAVLCEKLNSVMNEGVRILGAEKLPERSEKAMTIVDAAEWILSFREGLAPSEDWPVKLESYLERESLPALKKTKRGETTIDMKPLIYRYEIIRAADIKGYADENYRYTDPQVSPDEYVFHLLVSSGSSDHLKPSMVIENFAQDQGLRLSSVAIRLHRIETYLRGEDDKGTYERPLIESAGSRIYI